MKYTTLISFSIMLFGSFLSGYFGPWWAPAFFIVIATALMEISARQAIGIGSAALSFVFMSMAIWMSSRDDADIILKTGNLLGGLSPAMMITVTTIIGAVTGFFSGWLGSTLGRIFKKAD